MLGGGLGLAAAAGCLVLWQAGAPAPAAVAEVRVTASAGGELALLPDAELLHARALAPGKSAQGSVDVRNLTGAALRVTIRPRSDDLEGLSLELGGAATGGTGGRPATLELAPGEAQPLSVRAIVRERPAWRDIRLRAELELTAEAAPS